MAGGGIKPGITVGATDDLGYTITENPVSIHDLQATILHLLGLDAWKLTYAYQGLNQKLIGPEGDGQDPQGAAGVSEGRRSGCQNRAGQEAASSHAVVVGHGPSKASGRRPRKSCRNEGAPPPERGGRGRRRGPTPVPRQEGRPMTDARRNTPWFHLAAAAAFLAPFCGGWSLAADPGKLVLTCLEIPIHGDVGAGLAVVIETPGGKTFLYDTGNGYPAKSGDGWEGNYNAGRDTVLPFLKARGIKSIDGVLISHAHYDHFGGLMWLVDHVTVPKLIDSGYSYKGPPDLATIAQELADYEALRERFRKTRGAYQAAHAGDRLDLDKALDVEVISPPKSFFRANPQGRRPGDRPSHYLPNANSLGVRVTHGAVRILLPGDIQVQDQVELLLPFVAPEQLRCDVLVAPSHGIDASPEFARATRPRLTIASVSGRYAKGSRHAEGLRRGGLAGARDRLPRAGHRHLRRPVLHGRRRAPRRQGRRANTREKMSSSS